MRWLPEIYCVLTYDGCFEPYITTPYDQIIPEHMTCYNFSQSPTFKSHSHKRALRFV